VLEDDIGAVLDLLAGFARERQFEGVDLSDCPALEVLPDFLAKSHNWYPSWSFSSWSCMSKLTLGRIWNKDYL
jgi:hypothetical protein